MEGENHTKITKLKGAENWSTWKFQVRVLMSASEVFDVLNGTSLAPVLPAEATEAQITQHTQAMTRWTKKDGTAQKIISTSVTDQIVLLIMNYTSAKEMWDKLQSTYEQKNVTSIHLIQQKFYSFVKDRHHHSRCKNRGSTTSLAAAG